MSTTCRLPNFKPNRLISSLHWPIYSKTLECTCRAVDPTSSSRWQLSDFLTGASLAQMLPRLHPENLSYASCLLSALPEFSGADRIGQALPGERSPGDGADPVANEPWGRRRSESETVAFLRVTVLPGKGNGTRKTQKRGWRSVRFRQNYRETLIIHSKCLTAIASIFGLIKLEWHERLISKSIEDLEAQILEHKTKRGQFL